jgi:nucleoside 2-deoxyribosyltransferase
MDSEKIGQIYLAAPLFTRGEIAFNLELHKYLTKVGYTVFLPQKECDKVNGEDIYKICLRGLKSSKIVIAILDGADADSGTCWECGYAASRDIPIIAVRTDFRLSGDTNGFNAMLYYSAAKVIVGDENVFEEIARELNLLIIS